MFRFQELKIHKVIEKKRVSNVTRARDFINILPYSRRINIFLRIRKEENENMINRCSLYFYSIYFLNLLMLRLKNKEYENIKFSIYKKKKKNS
jgi:hypothetical protein